MRNYKEKTRYFFCAYWISENKGSVDIFNIITHLQNTISIHHISSNPKCDTVLKDESNMDSYNKISFFNKIPFRFISNSMTEQRVIHITP